MSALFLVPWRAPHYSAPIAGLVCVLLVQAMRHLRLWRWRSKPLGAVFVCTISIIVITSFITALPREMRTTTAAWAYERMRIVSQLQADGKQHLVIVRYEPRHSPLQDWVHNEADIDRANVVWAREMNTSQNQTLIKYFKNRKVWLLRVKEDPIPSHLEPYPALSKP